MIEELLYKLNEDVKHAVYVAWCQIQTLGDIAYEWAGLLFLGGLVMFVVMCVVELIWRV